MILKYIVTGIAAVGSSALYQQRHYTVCLDLSESTASLHIQNTSKTASCLTCELRGVSTWLAALQTLFCHTGVENQALVVTAGELIEKNVSCHVRFCFFHITNVPFFASFQLKLDGTPLSSSELSVSFSINTWPSHCLFFLVLWKIVGFMDSAFDTDISW